MKSSLGQASESQQSNSLAIGIVILAAGASTRMGTPKQLLSYRECSFSPPYSRGCSCLKLPTDHIVVLGAYAEQMRAELSQLSVQVVENLQWNTGMSSSIRAGIKALNAAPEKIEAVVLALCDQPFVSYQIINQLVSAYHFTGKPIVASEYAGTLGVPALFSHRFFSELTNLKDAEGAKQVMRKYIHEVFCVPFPEGAIDIDTPKDYEQLRNTI